VIGLTFPPPFATMNVMKIIISLVGDKYDVIRWPYDLLAGLIKKTKEHQRGWKKAPRPGLFSIQGEPKDMVILWRGIEIFLLILSVLYIQLVKIVFSIINFFKRWLF